MEKTNFYNFLFLVFLTSFCNSNDYEYENYKYDEYDYLENYNYDNQKPEDYTDYTDDYSQGLDDYYDQNLFGPPNPPRLPTPPPPMGRQYLIAGGNCLSNCIGTTEVVEFVKTTSTPSFGQLPSGTRIGAVGTMFGNAPILCGGNIESWNNSLDTCISYQEESEWSQSYSMIQKRSYAASVQVNSSTFWILGGYYFDGSNVYTDSTEFVIQGQSNGVPGPKLPYNLLAMCAVKLSENEIFVIGGYAGGYTDTDMISTGSRRDVWIYDPKNGFARHRGPSLIIGKHGHSCSTLRDGQKTKIIAAGGVSGELFLAQDVIKARPPFSVQIYDPTGNTWHRGKTYSN